jgi:hypothetical protein
MVAANATAILIDIDFSLRLRIKRPERGLLRKLNKTPLPTHF